MTSCLNQKSTVLQDMEARALMEAYFKKSNKPVLHKESKGPKKTYRTWDFPPVRHLPRQIPHVLEKISCRACASTIAPFLRNRG